MSARPALTPTAPWILSADGTDTPISGYALLDGRAVPRIEAVAHSLSYINRYSGHTLRPYSVAEHSLLVCDIVAQRGGDCHAQLLALMHDAHESLCGDVTAPVKLALGQRWKEFEAPLAIAMRNAHNLRATHAYHRYAVKRADLIALATERAHLTLFDSSKNAPWPDIDDLEPIEPLDDCCLLSDERCRATPEDWCDQFLARFHALQHARCHPTEVAF